MDLQQASSTGKDGRIPAVDDHGVLGKQKQHRAVRAEPWSDRREKPLEKRTDREDLREWPLSSRTANEAPGGRQASSLHTPSHFRLWLVVHSGNWREERPHSQSTRQIHLTCERLKLVLLRRPNYISARARAAAALVLKGRVSGY